MVKANNTNNNKRRDVIFPLSGDPFHYGHLEVIKLAEQTNLFDNIRVVIGENNTKKYLFSADERVKFAQKTLQTANLTNVTVSYHDGLIAHYARANGIKTIIKGVRDHKDYEFEQMQAEFNNSYNLNTLLIPVSNDYKNVSSSTIKAIISSGGLLRGNVHPQVKQALEEKLQHITLIGVTGNMGSGKTKLCSDLEIMGQKKGYKIKHYDVDKTVHYLYNNKTDCELYYQLNLAFGENIFSGDNLDRKKLAELVFGDNKKRKTLTEILSIPFKIEFEKMLTASEGIILVDAAYLVEYNMLDFVNYNLILVNCSEAERIRRVKNRDHIDLPDIESRLSAQIKNESLQEIIASEQKKINHGLFYNFDSERGNPALLFQDICSQFPQYKVK